MKLFRLTALLALIAFVYSTSGLALSAHERVEHADEIAQKSSQNSEPDSHPLKPNHPDHQHCATCQSLSALAKSVVLFLTVSVVVDTAPVHPDTPPLKIIGSVDVAPTPITSRGPPAC